MVRFQIILLISDTLLNVFLAIAVDNLANAQELTAAEEEQHEQEEVKPKTKRFSYECILFDLWYRNKLEF